MKVKDKLGKAKKSILIFCIYFLVLMLGLIFLDAIDAIFGDNEPMRSKVELYLPNGETEVYSVKGVKITHFGDVISFVNDEGEKISYNGDYKVETEKLPMGEVEDK